MDRGGSHKGSFKNTLNCIKIEIQLSNLWGITKTVLKGKQYQMHTLEKRRNVKSIKGLTSRTFQKKSKINSKSSRRK